MKFSEKLKKSREVAKMTQYELAKAIGVSQRSIAAYETDQSYPRKSKIEKLGNALKVSVKYLSDDECTDPMADIEKDAYVAEARALYGGTGAKDVARLLNENSALFAGGELSQDQKDEYFQAIMAMYVTAREEAKKKFGRKKV